MTWRSRSTATRSRLVENVRTRQRTTKFITGERHVLNIWAEVEDHAPEGYSSIYREYEVGDFECQFTLSGDFDAEKIEASLTDGVLRLTIPRAAEAAPRTIKVKAAG